MAYLKMYETADGGGGGGEREREVCGWGGGGGGRSDLWLRAKLNDWTVSSPRSGLDVLEIRIFLEFVGISGCLVISFLLHNPPTVSRE